MIYKNGMFTSECVTKGHPDKICDQISDGILDAYLQRDPMSRVACEVMATSKNIIISGEVTSSAQLTTEDIKDVAYYVLKDIYGKWANDEDSYVNKVNIVVDLNRQSPDIAQGVDVNGAGDQGMMYGYACNETMDYMPVGYMLARKMAMKLEYLMKCKELKDTFGWLKPDGKVQVTMEYKDGKPLRIDTVLVSCQHSGDVSVEDIKDVIMSYVINPVVFNYGGLFLRHDDLLDFKVLINPTGKFEIGGPEGDTGLTGRKIIVDTYGGYAHHGGGAFSGKDPTKVDRSAALMARKAAKWVVSAGYCDECEVQVAYAIGVAEPVSISVTTFGTSHDKSDEEIADLIRYMFDFTPAGIIKSLNLRRPIYQKYAACGHFGDNLAPWEKFGDWAHIQV